MATLQLMVCPHDTAKEPDRWFRFAQYCSQRIGTPLHFSVALDFEEFHQRLSTADLVFANPSDSVYLMEKQGFHPIVKPLNQYDEVVFIAHPSVEQPSLDRINGNPIAAVESLLPTKLALRMLARQGIHPAAIASKRSWLSVVSTVAKGTELFGIVYKDTFEEMAEKTKEMVQTVATSDEKLAFHSFLVGPGAIALHDTLRDLLSGMAQDSKGAELLHDLHITGWETITATAFAPVQELISG